MWVTRDANAPQVKWGTTSKAYTSTKNVRFNTGNFLFDAVRVMNLYHAGHEFYIQVN